jgi:putative addiction module killer protein
MKNFNVQEYIRKDGSSPFRKWFDSLDIMAAGKITVAMYRLESGNTSNIKWFEGIGEYRINWGPGYRIYLAREGNDFFILLCGGTKKTQTKDINKAKKMLQEFKVRKRK